MKTSNAGGNSNLEAASKVKPASDQGSDDQVLVNLSELSYTYPDGTRAVRRVSLRVPERKVISIVGPSGCGKSTLLAMMAGLLEPTSGAVEWGEQAQQAASQGQRTFTMMFQKDTLLPWLTVARNVAFGLRYLPLSKQEISERVVRLLALGRLEDFANSFPYQLSGGMRRRAALLAAVAPFPRLLLLDEPFSALDEPTRVELHRDVRDIVVELGMSVVLVTHDLAEAITLSDEVHILTKRPGHVAATHRIPFGVERDVMSLRETSTYEELYGRLWRDLRVQIQGGSS